MGYFSRQQTDNIFSENGFWNFIEIISIGDHLHEMMKPFFWDK